MISLTPSHIIEYLFCPRFTYFEYVLAIPQYEDKRYKVQKGRNVHENKSEQNREYLRKRIGVVKKQANIYLCNDMLRGEVDEVLTLKDQSMAPLDYKYAVFKDRIYDTYKTQLICYAWLIESNYHQPVQKGFLVYTRSFNKLVEISIDRSMIEKVKKSANEIANIIENNYFPKATSYKRRCIDCTYRNICIK